MDIRHDNQPNRRVRTRLAATVLAGSISLLGCTANQTTDTTHPKIVQKPSEPEFITDNNCNVSLTTVGINSPTEQSVSQYASAYVQHLGDRAGVDLSDCADDVIAAALHDPDNLEHGVSSPDSLSHSLSLPATVTKK